MDFLFPLAHAVSESLGKTIDKLNFRKNRVSSGHLIWLIFLGMSLSIALYVFITGKPFPHLSLAALGLLILIIAISFLDNVFDFASLKINDLSLREPMLDFTPILAGLVGYILLPAERKPGFLLAFALGAVIVYFGTHRRRLRIRQRKGMYYLFLSVVFASFLPVLYKWALEYLSPEYLALFRVISIFILASFFLPVKKRLSSPGKTTYGLLSGCVYAVGTVAGMYSIQKLGVVLSMLLFLLEPALKYTSGYLILNEKVRKGEVISSVALILIIVLTVTR